MPQGPRLLLVRLGNRLTSLNPEISPLFIEVKETHHHTIHDPIELETQFCYLLILTNNHVPRQQMKRKNILQRAALFLWTEDLVVQSACNINATTLIRFIIYITYTLHVRLARVASS